MEIDAGKTNSEGPIRSETYPNPPNWLVRAVRALIPPGPGSANEIIDVLLRHTAPFPKPFSAFRP